MGDASIQTKISSAVLFGIVCKGRWNLSAKKSQPLSKSWFFVAQSTNKQHKRSWPFILRDPYDCLNNVIWLRKNNVRNWLGFEENFFVLSQFYLLITYAALLSGAGTPTGKSGVPVMSGPIYVQGSVSLYSNEFSWTLIFTDTNCNLSCGGVCVNIR